jgi:hypothetical protein
MTWENKLELYDEIAAIAGIERKGKTVPFTSANGYMFSILNKDGELGIRFSKDVQKKYIEEWNTTTFQSHGATMRDYVLIPEKMWNDLDALADYLKESYDHVMSLEPK